MFAAIEWTADLFLKAMFLVKAKYSIISILNTILLG